MPDSETKHSRVLLLDDVENMLEAARPQLLRFACSSGVTPDAADDVVQETLLTAWRSLERLNSPECFQAWLYGICRNMCLRWSEAQRQHRQRQTRSIPLDTFDDFEHSFIENVIDPLTPEPDEVLIRQDLVTLLDRALGYLPDTTRAALELHYLAELPQKEVALRLGLTVNALEVRLHRARRQLRQVLSTQLGTDAQEFGLLLDEDTQAGWRETRIWCMYCARHRLQGRFEAFPESKEATMRFRCPLCSPSIGSPERDGELTYTGKMQELYGLSSFRVAWKRTIPASRLFWESVLQRKCCLYCGTRVEAHLLGPGERIPPLPRWPGLTLLVSCPCCDGWWSTPASYMTLGHAQVRAFMDSHPRWIVEPETFVEYSNHPAIQSGFVDIASATRLRIFLHAQTLEVFAVFQE